MSHVQTIDLNFMKTPGVIGCFLVSCPGGGFILLETGPASTLADLEAGVETGGFKIADLRAIFVTHVHLDHSGGAGSLARRTGADVYVHPKGAEHLLDPAKKLLPSAERLYGDMMVPLWGHIEAVPELQLHVVEDRETVAVSGLELKAWFTPGHAVHHIAWQIGDAVATGDIAGVRFSPSTYVLPPMPPPDINIEHWRTSLEVLRDISPKRLLLTHFGEFDDALRHIDEIEGRITRWTEIAAETVTRGGDRSTLTTAILSLDEKEMETASVPEAAVARYRHLCPMDGNSAGLFRYMNMR